MTAPVLNRLVQRHPEVRLTLRSGHPLARLRTRISAPFEHVFAASDFGFEMFDAIRVDFGASAARYRDAHRDWPATVALEAEFLASIGAEAVYSNVSYRPLAGAHRLGLPAVASCSLNWADLYVHYFSHLPESGQIWAEIRAAYANSRVFLASTPSMPMGHLHNRRTVGVVATPGQKQPLPGSSGRTVLVAMGGFEHTLNLADWPQEEGVSWLVPSAWGPEKTHNARAWESLGYAFSDVLASVDAVVTKPGYGTFTEAACCGVPVVYLDREGWPEQDALVRWLTNVGRCAGVPSQPEGAEILSALKTVWAMPEKPRAQPTGVEQIVEVLAEVLGV